jgi:hypothetical protein
MVPRKVHQKDWQNRISILDLIRQDATVTTEQLGKLLGISKRSKYFWAHVDPERTPNL